MKISELIKKLEIVLRDKGDIKVTIDDVTGDWGSQEATYLEYQPADGERFPENIMIGFGFGRR